MTAERETTVLVVDDDPFTAELTGMILEASGFAPIIAVGGPEALEKMAENPAVGVIVSDLNMPLIDGVELHDELRRQGCGCPFILLTGEEAAHLRAAHPRIDAVLTKNEQLQQALPETVHALLARSAAEREGP